MYVIVRQQVGYELVFGGSILPREIQRWLDDSKVARREPPHSCGLLIDMRALQPPTLGSRRLMAQGRQLYQHRGLRRKLPC